ncbi:unnamed protein product [Parnassius apollo]|uniref:(apollo) hypothetical protein n=1 Tax=Parnassius apollo TaxID=110799 RepID=A0A8S3Y2K1_PARAO|nr:unnamed protein product [Parnassius apollo]
MVSGTGPAPNQADTVAFWCGLLSEPVNQNEGPYPGLDGLHHYWLKGFVVCHTVLALSRGSQPEVAPEPLHYWDHPFGS